MTLNKAQSYGWYSGWDWLIMRANYFIISLNPHNNRNVADSDQPIAHDETVTDAGADPHRPGDQLLHRIVLLALLPVHLQCQLLLPRKPSPI